MILPQTFMGALILMILGMFCLGLWANFLKMAGGMRFELFYFDFAVGVGLVALLYGFTFGNLGYDGFSLLDDLSKAGKRQWLFAFLAGVILNLGNMLLTAAISVAGMSVAFPVALGVTLIGTVLISQGAANPLWLILGCVLVVAAIVCGAVAYIQQASLRRAELRKEGKIKRGQGPLPIKGLALALFGGAILRSYTPLMDMARATELGLGPYAFVLLLAAGLFFSTFVFNLFFMNLPVQGEPLEVMDILKSRPKQHLLGIVGGVFWCTGFLSILLTGSLELSSQIGQASHLALSFGGVVIAGLCGLLIWKEFPGPVARIRALAFGTLLLFACGLALLSMARQA